MNILFLGDIVGRDGRDIIFRYLPKIKEDERIDFTIANAENSAHGKGITIKLYNQFIRAGIDALTLGNHSYSKKEIIDHLQECELLIAPYNFEPYIHQGFRIFDVCGIRLCVCNLLGEAFMMPTRMSPFDAMEEILDKTCADIYFVDLHAEATAEKILFGQYFKDRITAVCGTHTHVQTADERLMGNMAYISDVGMNGVYDSVIGRDIEEMSRAHIKMEKTRYTIATGPAILSAVVINIDTTQKIATSIKRIQIRPTSVV